MLIFTISIAIVIIILITGRMLVDIFIAVDMGSRA